jgi:hypothetical protein
LLTFQLGQLTQYMDISRITYSFTLADGTQEIFKLELNTESIELTLENKEEAKQPPAWTKLDFHQCPNCPLNVSEAPHCPLCLNLIELVNKFQHILSYDKLVLVVQIDDTTISQRTTAQRAVSSLMGLLIATSGCPHTKYFKPMARFHLPLASPDHTLFRATSSYLLAQYFLRKENKPYDSDLQGLSEIYKNVDLVNDYVAMRLRTASEADSTVNAIILLDLFAKTIPITIEESLDEIKHLFASYLAEENIQY